MDLWDSYNLNQAKSKGSSIDALKGWRMCFLFFIFLVPKLFDCWHTWRHFSQVIWSCLILEESKPTVSSYSSFRAETKYFKQLRSLRDSRWLAKEQLQRIAAHLHTFRLNFGASPTVSIAHVAANHRLPWVWVTSGPLSYQIPVSLNAPLWIALWHRDWVNLGMFN